MKKVKILLLVAAIMIVATPLVVSVAAGGPDNHNTSGSDTGIKFYSGTWTEALALAKKENRPIFLDVSASWCGYCKKMKANIFTDKDVAEYYNSAFINVSLDGEKGDGSLLARKYSVGGYPTFLFFDPNGKLITQSAGYRNADQFLELGKNSTSK